MAIHYDHSGSLSDGNAGSKKLGSPDAVSWTDLEQSTDLNNGKGAEARNLPTGASADEAVDKHGIGKPPLAALDHPDGIDTQYDFATENGLLAAGSSPFKFESNGKTASEAKFDGSMALFKGAHSDLFGARNGALQLGVNKQLDGALKLGAKDGVDALNGSSGQDFFNSGARFDGALLAEFQGVSLYDSTVRGTLNGPAAKGTENSFKSGDRSSKSPISRLLAARKDSAKPAIDIAAKEAPPKFVPEFSIETGSLPPEQKEKAAPNEQGKLAIGLAVAPGERVHDASKVARAVVRLSDSEKAATNADDSSNQKVSESKIGRGDKLEFAGKAPLENPLQFVKDRLAAVHEKYSAADVKYSRTSRPDGTVVETHTAADYSTLTRTTNDKGEQTLVNYDPYRRPLIEQKADGSVAFNSYNDLKGRTRPFPSETLTVAADGRIARTIYTNMGSVESKLQYA